MSDGPAQVRDFKRSLVATVEVISNGLQSVLARPENTLSAELREILEELQEAVAPLHQMAKQFAPALKNSPPEEREATLRRFRHDLRGKFGFFVNNIDFILSRIPSDESVPGELRQVQTAIWKCLELMPTASHSAPVVAPEEEEGDTALAPPEPAQGRVARGRVLIADDDPVSGQFFSKFLAQDGHAVETVADGAAALTRLSAENFHVIILDLNMPVMNGFEVLVELRKRKLLRRLSVIVVSGSDDQDSASSAVWLGAEAYLTRPVDLRYLRAKVNACVATRIEQHAEAEMISPVYATFLSKPSAEYGKLFVQAYLESLMEVGGDCYFHLPLEGGCLLIGIADVSGDGWPAALDMVRVATLVTHTAPGCGPVQFQDWLVRLNNSLHSSMRRGGNNVALTALLIDPTRRRLQVACFGQHPPLYRDAPSGRFRALPCLVQGRLGVRTMKSCQLQTYPLGLGTHWVLCSDGLPESLVASGAQLELAGLIDLLDACDWSDRGNIEAPVAKWKMALPNGPRDDATLLLLSDAAARPAPEWTGQSRPLELQSARDYFRQCGEFAGIPEETLAGLVIGCDEILTNILRYAYGAETLGDIACAFEVEPTQFRFTIRHQGTALGPEEATKLLAQPKRAVGGSGLAVVHHFFSRVHFKTNEPAPGGEVVLEQDFEPATAVTALPPRKLDP